MHLRLAGVAAAAGHWKQGIRELSHARRLLGADDDVAMSARIDVIAARLAFGNPSKGRRVAAERLAGRALRAARTAGRPDVACAALEVLGRCARLRDLAEADSLYERGLALAEANNLVSRRIGLLYHLGAHDGIRAAEGARLRQALEIAERAGAVVTALNIELELAVVQICRGEYEAARVATARCEETAGRLRLTHTRLIALGERIMVAAHEGRASEVDTLLNRFRDLGGEDDDFATAVHGFGLALLHLLREDRGSALAELGRAAEHEATRPASYVSFVSGPALLLSVLAGEAGRAQCTAMARSAQVQAGWNHQFLHLARAVLEGRDGRRAAAGTAVARFLRLSEPYPLARHLGLRLAAPEAVANGWGEPAAWLRGAETYFRATAPLVARACRQILAT
ncbi:hypothetical protein [Pseudosporangium ferrugineum]|nr:hypothetical protein [Pseudosporangium ferrugineum]